MVDGIKNNGVSVASDVNDDTVRGSEADNSLVGQAVLQLGLPASGSSEIIAAEPGQSYELNFDAGAATPSVSGSDFILSFDTTGDGANDASIVFQNLVDVAQDASGAAIPDLVVDGTVIPADQLIEQVIALAAEDGTLETAAGAGPALGGGGSSYNDDLGSIIDLLNPQGPLGGTELAFTVPGIAAETPDPAEGTFTLTFTTTITEAPEGGITGTFAGGFEDGLPNQHVNFDTPADDLSDGDEGTNDDPFEGGSAEAFSAPMQLVFNFVPSDNETLDSVTITTIEGYDPTAASGETVRIFVGGFDPANEITGAALPIVITPENFGSVFILPVRDSDTDIDFSGTAEISDPDSGLTNVLPFSATAVIDAVADVPDFFPEDASDPSDDGGSFSDNLRVQDPTSVSISEEETLNLFVDVTLRDTDGSETLSLEVDSVPVSYNLVGLPEGWTAVRGDVVDNGDGIEDLQTWVITYTGSEVPAPTFFTGNISFDTSDYTTSGEGDAADGRERTGAPRTADSGSSSTDNGGDAVEQAGPLTITVSAIATESATVGGDNGTSEGELTEDNNVAVAKQNYTVNVAEDIPTVTSVSIVHDETSGVQNDNGKLDIALSTEITGLIDSPVIASETDNAPDVSLTAGTPIGAAQNSFTYDLKTDGSNDEGAVGTAQGVDGANSDSADQSVGSSGANDGLENLSFDLVDGTSSGLRTSDGNLAINLYRDATNDNIVYGVVEGTGEIAFAVVLGEDGNALSNGSHTGAATFIQYKPIVHGDTGSSDEQVEAEAADLTLTIRITDDEGDSATADLTIDIHDDGPVIGQPESGSVDEEGLSGGNAGAAAGVTGDLAGEETVATGNLNINFGSDDANSAVDGGIDGSAVVGDRAVTFADDAISTLEGLNLESAGDELSYALSANGTVLTATAGDPAREIFTVSLSDQNTGSYVFTLKDQLDHADGLDENDLNLTFNFTATDADGDQVDGSFGILVDDDTPVATDAVVNGAVQEDALNNDQGVGNSEGGQSAVATGSVSSLFSVGADAPGTYSLTDVNISDLPSLSSQGDAVSYSVSGNTLTATAGDNPVRTVFTLELDGATGGYTFTLVDQLDHLPNTPANDDSQTLTIDFASLVQLTDEDGDSVIANGDLIISIEDDIPVANEGDVTDAVQEDALSGANRENAGQTTTATGSIISLFSVGADEAPTYSLTTDTTELPSLSSQGEEVSYSVSGNTLTATAGDNPVRTVFTLELNSATGEYTFTLLDQLDHADDAANNDAQTLSIDFGSLLRVTDADGDFVDAVGSLTISVEDDIPVANEGDVTNAVQEDALSGGNRENAGQTTTATGSITGLFSVGADEVPTYSLTTDTAELPSLSSQGEAVSYSVSGNTLTATAGDNPVRTVFTLELNSATGEYTFTLLDQLDHADDAANNDAQTLSIDFGSLLRVTDADGDFVDAVGSLTISVEDDIPVANEGDVTNAVQEDALSDGNRESAGQTATATGSVAALFSVGADEPAAYSLTTDTSDLPSLTSNGLAVSYSVVGDTLTASTTAGDVFTLQLGSDGTYTFTLLDQVDHLPNTPANDDSQTLSIDFGSLLRATDADGDFVDATGSLTISIEDDIPVVVPDQSSNLISNGSFESNPLSGNAWGVFETIDGWTNGSGNPFEIQRSTGSIGGLQAQDGLSKVELDSHGNGGNTNATIQQIVSGAEDGESYVLTFWYAPRPNDGQADSSSLDVKWNGQTVLSIDSSTANAGWTQYSVVVQGTAGNDVLSFNGAGQENTLGAYLDNVSLMKALDEDDLPDGTDTDKESLSLTAALGISFGADQPGDVSVDADNLPQDLTSLTSGGVALVYSFDGDTNTLTANAGANGDPVFTVVFDAVAGTYTFTLQGQLDHPAGQGENVLNITIPFTASDADTDTVDSAITVKIVDDVPTVDATGAADALTVDESDLSTDATANFADNFTVDAGADGLGSVAYELAIDQNGAPSGVVDTATGQAVTLHDNAGVIEGRNADGDVVFTLSVDANGTVELDQLRAVRHPNTSSNDEPISLNANVVTLTATVTDGDGDTASDSIQLGSNITFEDDGPTISATGAADALTVDETVLSTDATANFADNFTVDAGADGLGSVAYELAIAQNGAASGVVDTATGQAVTLHDNAGVIEGRNADGDVVFTLSVDANGTVELDQLRAVRHPNTSSNDEPI
ncbi:T1SS-143 repeat domain-containing protein, partial [Kiloniella sp. b19]|uniref:T1SS-143 repeat domain-containing protein n=1 Tax=Kiloniella sp. GXU_MW_B19 TaxID=3141326 RepID=UPI0031E0C443